MPQTDNPWLTLVSLLLAGGTSIGIKEIVQAFLKRRPRKTVEVSNQIELAKQIQNYAEKVEKDAEQYRDSAREAWVAVTEANKKVVLAYQKLDETTYKFEQVVRYLDALFAKILDERSDIEVVRSYIKSRPAPFSRTPEGQ